jgi:hypothetical protein
MKKVFLSIPAVFLFLQMLSAQAYEGSIEYNKKKQLAYVIEYAYPQEAVQNAIIQKMAELGYKAKEEKGLFNRDKGFLVFKNASISDITGKTLDYFVKVDKKGKKDDDGAILYLVANNSNGENASTFFDNDEVRRAKGFLNNLQPEVEAANLEIQIRDQEDAVTKAEKKLKDLQDSKADMEKKIKNLQDDIEKNLKAQGETQKEIENQRQVLENLRAKRKTTDNL